MMRKIKGDQSNVKSKDATPIVSKSLTKNSRSWVSYTGKRNAVDHPLPKGEWRGTYQLQRGERTVIHLERTFLLE